MERLERRDLFALEPVSFTDSSFFGDTAFGARTAGILLSGEQVSLSADGQLIAFDSFAENLTPVDFNNDSDVFLYNRGTGVVTLISASASGLGTANDESFEPHTTPDGRFVVFRSEATDLASGVTVTTNGANDAEIYRYEVATGITELVSKNLAGTNAGNGGAHGSPSVSDDGNFIAWESNSTDLVLGDTNAKTDIFLRDMLSGTTTLVSHTPSGGFPNFDSTSPFISGNGNVVVFRSNADNLVGNDTNTSIDLFRFNRLEAVTADQVTLLTPNVANTGSAGTSATTFSNRPISGDGRFIVFESDGQLTATASGGTSAYLRDTQTNTTRLLSPNRTGTLSVSGFNVVITPNGQFAAFVSTSNNLESDILDTNGSGDVFLASLSDLDNITRRMVSVNSAGNNGGDDHSGTGPSASFTFAEGFPLLSDDGRFVAFSSEATNLVAGITDANTSVPGGFGQRQRDAFLRDMQTNETRLVSRGAAATTSGNDGSYVAGMSSDGRFVLLASHASDLVASIVDANQEADMFLADMQTNQTELVTPHSPLLRDDVLSTGGVDGLQDVSPDGRFVAFLAAAGTPNFFSPTVNGPPGDLAVFLRDRQTGLVEQVSVRADDITGNAAAGPVRVSDNGRFVTFRSSRSAAEFVAGATDTNSDFDVYVRDRQTGDASLISKSTAVGTVAGNEESGREIVISPNGRYVAFSSFAKNLVSGVTFPITFDNHLYLHDRNTGITRLLDVQSDGVTPGTPSNDFFPSFSVDSRKLVFVSGAGGLMAGVTDESPLGGSDAFVFDVDTNTLALVSSKFGAVDGGGNPTIAAGGVNGAPSISADGRFVAFSSAATNHAAIATSGSQVFRRDLLNKTTDLVSLNSTSSGGASPFGADSPFISADGRKVVFESASNNISPLATTIFDQIYVRDFTGAPVTSLVSLSSDGAAAGNFASQVNVPFNQGARITADGRFVTFKSAATNLVTGFVNSNAAGFDLYIRDLQTGITQLASHSFSGTSGSDVDALASVNGHGSVFLMAEQSPTVIFESSANNLLLGDNNKGFFEAGRPDIFAFRHDGAASIRGRVYRDDDGNGNQNGAEPGLPFRTVFLDGNGNLQPDVGEPRVQTDNSGDYAFTSLAAGLYTVAVVLDAGFARTEPADAPGTYAVNLATNTSVVVDRDFGQRQAFVDLAVQSVQAPAVAEPGEKITIDYTARNIGATPISGSWQDAIYASTDNVLDAGDTLLATLPRTGPLAANAQYFASVDVLVPAVLANQLHFLVVADNRRQITADETRANNKLATASPTALSIPTLALDTPVNGQFTEPLENYYFRLQVPVGETLSITLDSAAPAGITELYVSRVQLPTPADHEFAALVNSPDQTVEVPQTITPGEYFILVRSRTGAAANSAFTLTATLLEFGVESITPNAGGNTGRVTMEVRGTRFDDGTQVQLIQGATTLNPVSVVLGGADVAFATFDLTGVATGGYDVKVSRGLDTETLPGAFTVEAAVENPLDIRLITPGAIRQGRQSSVIVEYTNTGNTDLIAPLIELSATNAVLRLEDQSTFSGSFVDGNSIQFLAIAPDGPAGVLRPGQSGQVRVLFRAKPGEEGVSVDFEMSLLERTTTIDWPAQRFKLQPDSIGSLDAWNAIFANFMAEVGTTAGSFNDVLAENATYLSSLGIRTPTMSRLLGFEIDQASALLPGRTLASAVDAAVSTPGLPLAFGRAFQQSIQGRNAVDPFLGRGWTTPWSLSISGGPQSSGAVLPVVVEQGGVRRFFVPESNAATRFRGVGGDPATIDILPSGFGPVGYLLREANGVTVEFRERLVQIADPQGNTITPTYSLIPVNRFGFSTAVQLISRLTHSSGVTMDFSYNPAGFVSQITDSTGRTVDYLYDADFHLTSVSDAAGTTSYAYVTGQGAQREHALASITNPDGTHTFFEYDARGRMANVRRDGNLEQVSITYDDFSGVTFADALGAETLVLHNDSGRAEVVRDALGRESRFDYDRNFNLVRLVTPANTQFQYVYDTHNNLTRSVDALGRELTFTYTSEFNQLASLTDARGNTTRYAYDSESNLTSITYPNGGVEAFSYDPLGNLIETVNRRDQEIQRTVDSRGRTTHKLFEGGSFQTFTYDNHDNLLTATSAGGVISLAYDVGDRLTRIDYPPSPLAPLGRSLEFFYDAGGRRIRSVDQDGFTIKYSYDAVGRLFELRDDADALIVRYNYDATGRLVEKLNGNGTYTTYAYDAAGQLLSLINRQPRPSPELDGILNSRFDYTYDVLGLRASQTLTDSDPATLNGTTTYSYDALGQLTLVALPDGRTIAYAYDAAGNRTQEVDSLLGTTTYTTNNLNQILTAGPATFTYDADGNLATQSDLSGITAYTWDSENQLTGVAGPGGVFQYETDLFGSRSAQTVNGTRTEFLIDPTNLVNVFAEYTGVGLVANYVAGLGLESRVAANGSAAFYDFDALGSATGLTDAAGQYVNRYSYLPFGETTTHTSALANAFTFVGQFGVSQSGDGLSHMGFREYSPLTGQFLSNDPLGIGGGDANFRAYVGNNSVNLIDPIGLAPRPTLLFTGTLPETAAQLVEAGIELVAQHEAALMPDPVDPLVGKTIISTEERIQSTFLVDQLRARVAFHESSFGARAARFFGRGLGIFGRGAGLFGPLLAIAPLLPQASEAARRVGEDLANSPEGQELSRKLNDGLNDGFRDLCDLFPDLCRRVPPVFAQDPNDIIGPAGLGSRNFLPAGVLLPYTIHFENEDSATAPAQEVFVTLPLSPHLDLSTFELGDFGFGPLVIDVPEGRQEAQDRVEFKNPDGSPLFVDFSAKLDPVTRVVTWVLRSIDPATGELPEDPFAGFLPPNDDEDARGEGFFEFTIRSLADAAPGSEIRSVAGIVFDTNAPIFTNQVDPQNPAAGTDPNKEALVTIAGPNQTLRKNGNNVELLTDAGQVMLTQALTSTAPIVVNTLAAEFTLDYSGGLFDVPGGLTYNGGNTGVDRLVVQGDAKSVKLTDSKLTVAKVKKPIILGGVNLATLIGGAGNNKLDAAKFSGDVTFDGGAGKDTFTGGAGDDTIFVGAGKKTIKGNAGVDKVIADAGGAVKLTNKKLSSSVANASLKGIEEIELTGTASDDVFTVTGWTGSAEINGGNGLDRLVLVENVDMVLTDTLLTRSAGGALVLASIEAAELTGGKGDNTLDASAFSGFTFLSGVGGNDVLKAGLGGSLLLGGKGNDDLQGNLGRDILLGGAGQNTQTGVAGEDLLFGKPAKFESKRAVLDALFAQWSRTDLDFAARVAMLAGGTTGVAKFPKLDAKVLKADKLADTLTGGADLDWFFADLPVDTVTDVVDQLTDPRQ